MSPGSSGPPTRAVTADENAVAVAAMDAIRTGRQAGRTTVAAAVRGQSGAIYLAYDCPSRMSGVCAEPAAIATAWRAGETGIATVAAACWTPDLGDVRIISPCGACRERLWYHAPGADVLVTAPCGEARAVAAADLFPFAELFPTVSPPPLDP